MIIKFKIWDKTEKYMKTTRQAVNTIIQKFVLDTPDKENYEALFYTQRKDRNGVEVYRHDVVRAIIKYVTGSPLEWSSIKTKEVVGVVEWNNKGWWYLKVLNDMFLKEVGFYAVEEIVEVLGNIHDNPKLLKKYSEE